VLRATVLVVVVLTVIIFGGTTARMLDILNIKTGVVEEIDSDDEFDIEYVSNDQGIFSRKSGAAIGHHPRRASANGVALGDLDTDDLPGGAWSSSNGNGHAGNGRAPGPRRANSARRARDGVRRDAAERSLLSPDDSGSASQAEESDTAVVDDDEFDFDAAADLDLPPAARRIKSIRAGGSPATGSPAANSPRRPRTPTSAPQQGGAESLYPTSGIRATPPRGASVTEVAHNVGGRIVAATGVMSQLISGLSEDPAEAFRQIDEDFIKPHLLLDPGSGGGGHNGQV
jgi:sodium/hydrogen exchanger-like protein 6/7